MNQNKIIDNFEIKAILLNLLKTFDNICRNYDLKYSLCGGTLLGAVRHKGFIPWDDDVDVFMKRDQYEKFCLIFKKVKKPKYFKLLNYYSHNYYATFAKLIDSRTFSTENTRNEKLGVWIDLHIIDYMPTKNIAFYGEMIEKVKEIRYFGTNNYLPGDIKEHKLGKCPNPLINFKKKFVRFYKKRKIRNFIEIFIKTNRGDSEISFSFGDKVSFWCQMSNLDFDNLINLRFENLNVMCIKNYDKYLSAKYGDYMIIPSKKDRRLHDVKVCRWK